MTPLGIEHATFLLVIQCHKKLHYRVCVVCACVCVCVCVCIPFESVTNYIFCAQLHSFVSRPLALSAQ